MLCCIQGKRDKIEQSIAKAKDQKLGIWAEKGRISAAEHKKRTKNGKQQQPQRQVNVLVPRGGVKHSETSSTLVEAALTGLEFVA